VNYIALAIPVFLLLIGIELLAARVLERDSYRLGDSVGDLSCGVLQQLTEVFLKTALFAAYATLYASHRRFDMPTSSAWAWVACFLGYDLLYYVYHRFSHEVNAGWASHVVHHQSEEYNLTVALRQAAIPVSWVFYLPLALVGFPPAMFLTVSAFDTLYQFWIHTRLVGRLGPLEWVLNTPSHHRVHHGRNPRYIDKNHGGTLIVWDRLFGTFAEEREEPVYGITKPLASFNPLWANLHYWVEMWDVARRAARPFDRLRVLWQRPGWRPADLGGPLRPPEVDRASYVKFEVPLDRPRKLYVLAQFLPVLLATAPFVQSSERFEAQPRLVAAALIAWSLLSIGGLIERRPWALGLESTRLVALALAGTLLPSPLAVRASLVLLAVASLVWVRRLEKPLPLIPEVR
jgi:alkylglycerol monooxygenase